MTSIRCGDWIAEFRPEIGGAMSTLRLRGVEILRSMPDQSTDPLESSCFPLLPYCNRLRKGRFGWLGRQVSLPLNFIPEANTLHGLGWKEPWNLENFLEPQVNLNWGYPGGETWTGAFGAQQQVSLDEHGCTIALSAHNRGKSAIPMGLGLHPYFRRGPETSVRFDARSVILTDHETMPTGIEAPPDHFGDFSSGSALPGETVDHCYRSWGGSVTIEDDLGSITMTATGAPHLHVYAPADGSALCFEPVSHTPDALNRAPEEMIELEPGETARLTMRIEANLA